MSQVVSSGSSNIVVKSNYQNRNYGSTINKSDVMVTNSSTDVRENEVEEYDFSDNIVSKQLRKVEEGHKMLEQQKLDKEIEEIANMSEEEIINMYINNIDQSSEKLENDKKFLEEKYKKIVYDDGNTRYPDLWTDGYSYLNPIEFENSDVALEHFLIENGYNTSYASDERSIGVEKFHEYVKDVYTPAFDKYFTKEMGMTFVEYRNKIVTIKQDIQTLESSRYALVQEAKLVPFDIIFQSEEYKKYALEKKNNKDVITVDGQAAAHGKLVLYCNGEKINENIYGHIKNPINPISLGEAIDSGQIEFNKYNYGTYNTDLHSIIDGVSYEFLSEDEKLLYSYLFDTKGKEEADKYIKAMQDTLNQRKGMRDAREFLKEIFDENGNIIPDADTKFDVFMQGMWDGVENFGEGLTNVLNSDGVMSDNQYETMFIMQALTSSAPTFLNSIAEDIKTQNDEEAYNEFISGIMKDGEINLEYAEKHLTKEQYNSLIIKMESDDSWNSNYYEIGMSIGNMLPVMLVSGGTKLLTHGASVIIGGETIKYAKIAGNLAMGMSIYGNSQEGALINGADRTSAILNGCLNSLSEVGFEYFLGSIPGISKDSSNFIVKMFKEGSEELIQEYVGAGINAVTLGETIDLSKLSDDALKSFFYGAITTAILNGGAITLNVTIGGVKKGITSVAGAIEVYRQAKSGSNTFNGTDNFENTNSSINLSEVSANVTALSSDKKSILDNFVEKNGDSARRIMLLYRNFGNIDVIPFEYRDAFKNITSADINNYLNIDTTGPNIGLQYFGRKNNTPDNDNIIQRAKDKITSKTGSIFNPFGRKNNSSILNSGAKSISNSDADIIQKLKIGIEAMNQKYAEKEKYVKEYGKNIGLGSLCEYLNSISQGTPAEKVLYLLSSAGDFRKTVKDLDYDTLVRCVNAIVDEYNAGVGKTNMHSSVQNKTTISSNNAGNKNASNVQKIISNISNPLAGYTLVSKIADAFYNPNSKGMSAYQKIVTANGIRKSIPSVDSVESFDRRFNSYRKRYQGNGFTHIYSKLGMPENIKHRLYLNGEMDSTLEFANIFASECERIGIPFYFKVGFFKTDGSKVSCNDFTLARDESIVIYCNDAYFSQYAQICDNIIKSNPNLKFYSPPLLTGKLTNAIGYGAEPNVSGTSFNTVRSNLIGKAIAQAEIQMVDKYGSEVKDENDKFDYLNIKRYGAFDFSYTIYDEFIDCLKSNIINLSNIFGVSSKNFCVNNR